MTRNLYLGGNLNAPVAAALSQPTPGAALVAFGNANTALWQTVQATNFPARAVRLAEEIDTHKPDLIGLQEVALWRSGPLELPNPDGTLGNFAVPNSTTVEYDFLQILLDELEAVGQDYHVVTTTTEADVEAPSFLGIPGTAQFQPIADRRLTMRDVILRRDDVRVLKTGTANYENNFALSLGGRQFKFTRGYGWADVVVEHEKFRFINTHLESELSTFALAQAQELLAGPASLTSKPVVLVCDCNSDPLNDTIKNGEPVPTPHSAPYNLITGSGGFTDEWLRFAPAEDGWTSGLSELLDDTPTEAAARFDHRIDMVFGRRPSGKAIPILDAAVTGRDPDLRTDSINGVRLWPSDHAGVVAELAP